VDDDDQAMTDSSPFDSFRQLATRLAVSYGVYTRRKEGKLIELFQNMQFLVVFCFCCFCWFCTFVGVFCPC